MSEAMTRTVDALAVSMLAAAEWHKDCIPRRTARAAYWFNRSDAYKRAAAMSCPSLAKRAETLAMAAKHRGIAWAALARMDAPLAAAARLHGHVARRMAAGVTAGVWVR